MIEIPEALSEKLGSLGPHFIRVRKRGKESLDKGWPINPLSADDSRIMDWLKQGGNYGVIGGFGLTIVDLDSPELIRIVKEKLPQTFTVQSPGSRGLHLYYISSLEKPIRLRDKDGENIGDVQGPGKMVVGPGSIHPNGGVYKVIKDIPLAQVTRTTLIEALGEFVVPDREIKRIEAAARTEKRETDIDLDILQVLSLAEFRKQGDEYYGPHPVHGSKMGRNCWVNPSKNVGYCFRHGTGGGPLIWFAIIEGIIDCSQAVPGALRGEIFKKVLQKARERDLIKEKPKQKKSGEKDSDAEIKKVSRGERKSQASKIVELVLDTSVELFHDERKEP